MTDLMVVPSLADHALVVLKAWLMLSLPATGLLGWLFYNADPRREAGLAVRGRPKH